MIKGGWIAAPPGVHRRQPERLAQQPFTQLRQEGQEPRILQDSRTDVVHYADRALPYTLNEAGDAQPRPWPQFQRVAPVGIHPAQDHIDLLQPAEHSHPDPAVPYRQVTALKQWKAQQGGDKRLIERSL